MRKRNLALFIIAVSLISLTVFLFLKFNQNSANLLQIGNYETSPARWEQDATGWKAIGNPPPCPEPLRLSSVVDVTKATSVLYPGQIRSVGYENTAGFRFDGLADNNIIVKAPMDGEIVQAARFLVGGELQYVIDILSPCGIMNRFDHILTLSEKLQNMADKLPKPKANDSRSTSVNPPVSISQGEVLATAIGLSKNKNVFLSWTVFDFRKKNKISQNLSWAKEHPTMDHYVVCPFPLLPKQDQELVRSLPAADFMSGSKSDFCIVN